MSGEPLNSARVWDWIFYFGGGLCIAAAFLFVGCDQAHAASVAANAVLAKLNGMAFPALAIGVVWFGYLFVTGQASMHIVVLFVIGAAIVFGGGFF